MLCALRLVQASARLSRQLTASQVHRTRKPQCLGQQSLLWVTPKSMTQAMEAARCHIECHLNPVSGVGCCGTLGRPFLFSVTQVFMSEAGQFSPWGQM